MLILIWIQVFCFSFLIKGPEMRREEKNNGFFDTIQFTDINPLNLFNQRLLTSDRQIQNRYVKHVCKGNAPPEPRQCCHTQM